MAPLPSALVLQRDALGSHRVYELVKANKLPASELLQDAVRAELRRRGLMNESDA